MSKKRITKKARAEASEVFPRERDVVRRRIHGDTHVEIGKYHGVSADTVRQILRDFARRMSWLYDGAWCSAAIPADLERWLRYTDVLLIAEYDRPQLKAHEFDVIRLRSEGATWDAIATAVDRSVSPSRCSQIAKAAYWRMARHFSTERFKEWAAKRTNGIQALPTPTVEEYAAVFQRWLLQPAVELSRERSEQRELVDEMVRLRGEL